MGNSLKKICFINGSLKGKKSSSIKFINEIEHLLSGTEYEKDFVQVKARFSTGYIETVIKKISESDIIVIAFPLYTYCLPGALTMLLEEYYEHFKTNTNSSKQKVYAIVNCAYVEPKINDEAIRVVKNFCLRLNLNWRFAISIGGGPITALTKSIDIKLRTAFKKMAVDINTTSDDQIKATLYIKPIIPRIFLDSIRMQIDRNSLKKKTQSNLVKKLLKILILNFNHQTLQYLQQSK